jgi:hypothetical protein
MDNRSFFLKNEELGMSHSVSGADSQRSRNSGSTPSSRFDRKGAYIAAGVALLSAVAYAAMQADSFYREVSTREQGWELREHVESGFLGLWDKRSLRVYPSEIVQTHTELDMESTVAMTVQALLGILFMSVLGGFLAARCSSAEQSIDQGFSNEESTRSVSREESSSTSSDCGSFHSVSAHSIPDIPEANPRKASVSSSKIELIVNKNVWDGSRVTQAPDLGEKMGMEPDSKEGVNSLKILARAAAFPKRPEATEAAKQAILRRGSIRLGQGKTNGCIQTEEQVPPIASGKLLTGGGGVSSIYRADMGNEFKLDSCLILKTFEKIDQQRATQVEVLGRLASFMPKAQVVAARRKGRMVFCENLPDLKVGPEAIKGLNLGSIETQHTALAALSFQMWDLHLFNIGIGREGHLVIFDSDIAFFESNRFGGLGDNVRMSPLGHNYLQDLNPLISETVLEEHLSQLDAAITAEFVGVSQNFQSQDVKAIQDLLFHFFARRDDLSIHGANNNMLPETSLEAIKRKFLKALASDKDAVTKALAKRGISDAHLRLLKKYPYLLHPKRASIRQIQALMERRDRLRQFLALRTSLRNFKTGAEDKALEQLALLVLENIDALPATVATKRAIWNKLKGAKHGGTYEKERPLFDAQALVTGPITWNILARSMYPTLMRLHSVVDTPARKRADGEISRCLTHKKDARELYSAALEDEIKRLEAFDAERTSGSSDHAASSSSH